MSDFLKNHWASMVFVLCAFALFATEIYAPLISPLWGGLLVFVVLSFLVFFLGCGVNINDNKSWITFFVVSPATSLAQGFVSAYLLGSEHLVFIVICTVFFALWYFILAAFATIVIKNSMQRGTAPQVKPKRKPHTNRFFLFDEPVQIYKHKIVGVEEKPEHYKLEFDSGTWINLRKLKRKGRKPAPPKVGDDITLYLCNGDFVGCDLRGRKWFRWTNLEER